MKHTPLKSCDKCKMCRSVENGHRSIALGYGVICDGCLPKLKLMANAAPDLLEACKELIKWAEKGTPISLIQELDVVIKKVKRVISKAEGK